MRLVPLSGAELTQILDETFPLWGEGLSRRGYEQWNLAQLQTLAGRPEVDGALVDLSQSARIAALNAQADAHTACPTAKNLVAGAIKDVVDSYRANNPLAYVVAVGNDFDTWTGMCGKNGQSVPVSSGQPTLLVREMTVGGTAA